MFLKCTEVQQILQILNEKELFFFYKIKLMLLVDPHELFYSVCDSFSATHFQIYM